MDTVSADSFVSNPSSVKIGVSKIDLMDTAILAQEAITCFESEV
ncbi:hypothetical protein EVA_12899 [gut metagenome]|uniref:Uncharacterized protein n=1 Tax=gut metagenome TaxID=749906 RepID=J9CG27_9ZZZZ